MTVSFWHWIIVLAMLALYVWPISLILKRIGFSPWWSLVALLGPIAWIGLWVLARSRWPIEDRWS